MSAEVAPPPVQLQLELDPSTASGVYANLALVHHNESEFTIDFYYVQPQAPKASLRARVINSPQHMKRLMLALQDNIGRFEAQFGRIELASAQQAPPKGFA